MASKTIRRLPSADPERLSIDELIAAHERVFGPLEPQARARIARAADAGRMEGPWTGMDGLAA
jgi:hypothetical protein